MARLEVCSSSDGAEREMGWVEVEVRVVEGASSGVHEKAEKSEGGAAIVAVVEVTGEGGVVALGVAWTG